MRIVSIEELKRKLSGLLTEAAGGERIVVTRHNRRVATICAVDQEHVRVGSAFGRARLRPALNGASQGKYLGVLAEDRLGGERARS